MKKSSRQTPDTPPFGLVHSQSYQFDICYSWESRTSQWNVGGLSHPAPPLPVKLAWASYLMVLKPGFLLCETETKVWCGSVVSIKWGSVHVRGTPTWSVVVVLVRKRDSVWEGLTAVGHTAPCALSKGRVTASVFPLLVPSPSFSVLHTHYLEAGSLGLGEIE